MLGLSANEITPHHAVWKHTQINSAALLVPLSHAGIIQRQQTNQGDSLYTLSSFERVSIKMEVKALILFSQENDIANEVEESCVQVLV